MLGLILKTLILGVSTAANVFVNVKLVVDSSQLVSNSSDNIMNQVNASVKFIQGLLQLP